MQLCLIRKIITDALTEDIGEKDITTEAVVRSQSSSSKAVIVAKSKGVLAGIEVAKEVFRLLDPQVKFLEQKKDGGSFFPEDTLLELEASPGAILKGERTALNFLQRLSGIASLTQEFVRRASPHGVNILDTRKTTPTLRLVEKYAVKTGGGLNHRFNLGSGILIKDNHIKIAGDIKRAVKLIRKNVPGLYKTEVEVTNEKDLAEAIACRIDAIMLDNFNYPQLKSAIQLIRKKSSSTLIEVSGGINLDNVKDIARLKPDFISVGRITHSAPAVDMSLNIKCK